MTLAQIEERLEAIERELERLKQGPPLRDGAWWVRTAGAFKDDPMFEEVIRLGREYRESQQPGDEPEVRG